MNSEIWVLRIFGFSYPSFFISNYSRSARSPTTCPLQSTFLIYFDSSELRDIRGFRFSYHSFFRSDYCWSEGSLATCPCRSMTTIGCGDSMHSLFNFTVDLRKENILVHSGINIHHWFVDLKISMISSDYRITTCSFFKFLHDPYSAMMLVRSRIDICRWSIGIERSMVLCDYGLTTCIKFNLIYDPCNASPPLISLQWDMTVLTWSLLDLSAYIALAHILRLKKKIHLTYRLVISELD